MSSLTWFSRQVLEVHWLADLAVRRPAQLHLDSDWLGEIRLAIGRRAKHDGHLPVDVSLGESPLPLPGVLEKTHLDVLCRGPESMKHEDSPKLRNDSLLNKKIICLPQAMLHYVCCYATQCVSQHLTSLVISFGCQTSRDVKRKKGLPPFVLVHHLECHKLVQHSGFKG